MSLLRSSCRSHNSSLSRRKEEEGEEEAEGGRGREMRQGKKERMEDRGKNWMGKEKGWEKGGIEEIIPFAKFHCITMYRRLLQKDSLALNRSLRPQKIRIFRL